MSRPALTTRKPVDQLTADDLAVFAIWEFAIDEEGAEDGQDETWVRPVDSRVVPLDAWSLSVAADFRTSSGASSPGLVGVTTAQGIELGHAVLLPGGRYVFVEAHEPDGRTRTADALNLAEHDVFPLTFTLRVPIEGESELRTGSLPQAR